MELAGAGAYSSAWAQSSSALIVSPGVLPVLNGDVGRCVNCSGGAGRTAQDRYVPANRRKVARDGSSIVGYACLHLFAQNCLRYGLSIRAILCESGARERA